MRLLILLCIGFLLDIPAVFADPQRNETMTFTTYYPSPTGVYQNLRVYPQSLPSISCSNSQEGNLYYNNSTRVLYICTYDGAAWAYVPVPGAGGLWTLNGNNVTLSNTTWNVGIGTNTPQRKLDIYGSSIDQVNPSSLRLNSLGEDGVLVETATSSNAFWNPKFSGWRRRGSIALPSNVAQYDTLLELWGGGHNAAAGASNSFISPAASILFSAAENPNANGIPGKIEFWTTPAAAASPTRKMTIEDDGNVGIGLGSFASFVPTATLQVGGDIRIAGYPGDGWTAAGNPAGIGTDLCPGAGNANCGRIKYTASRFFGCACPGGWRSLD